ncbi:MAG: metal-dependent hydrolase [Cyanobacteria bacterium J06649_5]
MSSFIGHGLAAVTTFSAVEPQRRPFTTRIGMLLWLSWLIVIAWAPDIDHVVPALTLAQNDGARITHAIASSLLLPAVTVIGLYWAGLKSPKLRLCLWQTALAGLSHPVMDWLVGVIGLPLFWPFHPAIITAPIGLLPSAGSPHWQNYYFYANLWIELGIIVPLMIVVLRNLAWQEHKLKPWQTGALVAILAYFLNVSMGLSR